MFQVTCPKCGRVHNAQDEHRGRQALCRCGTKITLIPKFVPVAAPVVAHRPGRKKDGTPSLLLSAGRHVGLGVLIGTGIVLLLLGVVVFVAMHASKRGFFAWGPEDKTRGTAGLRLAAPAVVIDATALLGEYKADEPTADAKFRGKILLVTGDWLSVGRDNYGNLYLTLATDERDKSIQCFMTSRYRTSLPSLRKGMPIHIRGRCGGKTGNVLLSDCDILKSNGEIDEPPASTTSAPASSPATQETDEQVAERAKQKLMDVAHDAGADDERMVRLVIEQYQSSKSWTSCNAMIENTSPRTQDAYRAWRDAVDNAVK